MKNQTTPKIYTTTTVILTLFTFLSITQIALCRGFGVVNLKKVGGSTNTNVNTNDQEIVDDIARFAVQEHNKQSNGRLKFQKVLKANEQVVAGKIYDLTLELIDAGKKTVYVAKVWVKPWMNFKQLQEFKRVPHFTASDLGSIRDGFGWREVPVDASEVQDAAKFAVTTLTARSNCLGGYKLLEILQAEAEVDKHIVKYKLLLWLKTLNTKEKMMFNLQKTAAGDFDQSVFNFFDVK